MATPQLTPEQIAQVSGLVAECTDLDFHDCVHKLVGNQRRNSQRATKIGSPEHFAHGLGQRHDDSGGAKLARDSARVAGAGCGRFGDPDHKRINS